jgi:hypothetical protein
MYVRRPAQEVSKCFGSSHAASPTPKSAPASSLSAATIKTHVTRILAKLDVRDRVQAVVLAYEAGIIEPGSTDT